MVKITNLKSKLNSKTLHVIPFGGCGEFGMNVTAYILKRKLFIVDAGSMFPAPHQLGVHCLIPDLDEVVEFFGGVEAYFITHGHEDHIGSLPYLYRKWQAPIYGTRWTIELIERKFKDFRLNTDDIILVEPGETVKAYPLDVSYIHVNHSIPDACSLLIDCCDGETKVFHTGDFKIDPTPVGTYPIDLNEIKEIGERGVDLLIADSTNSHSSGPSPSEKSILKPLEQKVAKAKGRVFITTFSSNLWRLQVIVDICAKLNKKLAVFGRGLQNCLELGIELGYLEIPEDLIVEQSQIKQVADHKLVCLVSGTQGEPRSVLVRIANREHPQLKMNANDVLIFSARAIPGNEKSISMMCDKLLRQGVEIIDAKVHKEIHVSGHAYQEDLETMLELVNPTHYLPVHGTFSHLKKNSKISEEMNFTSDDYTLIENGDILKVSQDEIMIVGKCDIKHLYVDQYTYEPIEREVLMERLKIGEFGLILVTGVLNKTTCSWTSLPDFHLQGVEVPYPLSEENWMQDVSYALSVHLNKWLEKNKFNDMIFQDEARLWLRRKAQQTLHKKPIVIVKFEYISNNTERKTKPRKKRKKKILK